jgi:hypothetical protein
LETSLWGLWIVLLPSNLFLKWGESTAYVHGLHIDYLLPKLYVSDLVLIGLGGVVGLKWWWQKSASKGDFFSIDLFKKNWHWLVVSAALLARQVWTIKPWAALWYSSQIGLALLVGHLAFKFWEHAQHWQKSMILVAIGLSVMLQSGLGVYQFWFQKNLLPYHWLGESNLHQGWNIATATLANGHEYILPLGTTPHPNILAGVIVISLGILWQLLWPRKVAQKSLLVLISLSGLGMLYLARSASAWLACGLLVGGYLAQNATSRFGWEMWQRLGVSVGLLLFLAAPFIVADLTYLQPGLPSTERRDYLNRAAVEIFLHKPLLGTGLNNFTVWVEDFTEDQEIVRFTQPVHHVGLLWLAETGLLGLLWLGLTGHLLWSNLSTDERHRGLLFLAVLTPLLSFDHYLLTQHMGLLLMSFSFALVTASSSEK